MNKPQISPERTHAHKHQQVNQALARNLSIDQGIKDFNDESLKGFEEIYGIENIKKLKIFMNYFEPINKDTIQQLQNENIIEIIKKGKEENILLILDKFKKLNISDLQSNFDGYQNCKHLFIDIDSRILHSIFQYNILKSAKEIENWRSLVGNHMKRFLITSSYNIEIFLRACEIIDPDNLDTMYNLSMEIYTQRENKKLQEINWDIVKRNKDDCKQLTGRKLISIEDIYRINQINEDQIIYAKKYKNDIEFITGRTLNISDIRYSKLLTDKKVSMLKHYKDYLQYIHGDNLDISNLLTYMINIFKKEFGEGFFDQIHNELGENGYKFIDKIIVDFTNEPINKSGVQTYLFNNNIKKLEILEILEILSKNGNSDDKKFVKYIKDNNLYFLLKHNDIYFVPGGIIDKETISNIEKGITGIRDKISIIKSQIEKKALQNET